MQETTNQLLKPVSTKINDKGNIEVGGCDLKELAYKYGTPLYVVDEDSIRSICREYKDAFKDYKRINMMYASKALCSLATSKLISSEGFGFDVVSGGELYTVYKSGADMSKVLFNGNNKTQDELQLALELKVGRFSVDNFFELKILNNLANKMGKAADILLRVTPGIECHTHEYIQTGHLDSKFGFDLTQTDDAINLIVNEYKNLKLRGIHAHIGSQIFETKVYEDEVDILVKEISRINKKYGLNLDEINIGGGLGVKYTEDDEPPSTYDIAKVIISSIRNSAKKYEIQEPLIYIEPGRSIISTAGITLYKIGSSKQVPKGKKYIAVDGGMADNIRPAMYQASYYAEIVGKNNKSDLQNVTISGRFCESGDILIENIKLPKPEEGDILCVFNTGAYNYSMASNYNRTEKPAMVLVNNSQSDIIIDRESLDDLISHDVIPNRLR